MRGPNQERAITNGQTHTTTEHDNEIPGFAARTERSNIQYQISDKACYARRVTERRHLIHLRAWQCGELATSCKIHCLCSCSSFYTGIIPTYIPRMGSIRLNDPAGRRVLSRANEVAVFTMFVPQPFLNLEPLFFVSSVSKGIPLSIRMDKTLRLDDMDPRIDYSQRDSWAAVKNSGESWNLDGTYHRASTPNSWFFLVFRGESFSWPFPHTALDILTS